MTRFGASDPTPEVSFETFASASSTRLLRAAYLLCGNRQTAEDLLQTAMIRTGRRWGAARSAPEAYARAVLVNLARDEARRARRRVEEVLGDADPGDGPSRHLITDHAEQVANRDAMLAALAVLPQRQREVIVLRFYADLSVTETAAAIGASQGTVMSYTSRALARLRELLGERLENSDQPVKAEVQHGHR